MTKRSMLLRAALPLLAFAVMAGCGGGDGGPTPPADTAASYTADGWDAFETGDYQAANTAFLAALALNGGYGPAHAGLGWTALQSARTSTAMLAAAANFTDALNNGETGAEVSAGRAAARLGAGGVSLAGAVTDAQAARTAAPAFSFTHRAGFDVDDLRLIEAFAQIGLGNVDAALAAADLVQDSGIEAASPATWQVGTTVYGSYAAAVLAHLHALSEEYAG
ncbi:MAG TPA: hypothetical protein P5571_13295 [Candidatus Krumholzibacteria bacterium]|nr:hypothetical protein [Candidatus Krumholzibacteria bacterium]HRX52338.1 hypothetical protein [Candidatus Krumholzibacteria bacterium]